MASRKDRMDLGQEAKARVLSGMYSQPQASTAAPSRKDRLILKRPMSETTEFFNNSGGYLMNKVYDNVQQQKALEKKRQEEAFRQEAMDYFSTPVLPRMKQQIDSTLANLPRAQSTWEALSNKWKSEDTAADSKGLGGQILHNVTSPFTKTMDTIAAYTEPFAKGAGDILGIPTADVFPNADNLVNKAMYGAGAIGGAFTNPAALEQNLATLPYQIANKALAGKAASKLVSKLPTAVERGLKGSMAGAGTGAAYSLVSGHDDTEEVAKNALFGAAAGALLDPLVGAAGDKIGKLLRGKEVPEVKPDTATADSIRRNKKMQAQDDYISNLAKMHEPIYSGKERPIILGLPESSRYAAAQELRRGQQLALPEPSARAQRKYESLVRQQQEQLARTGRSEPVAAPIVQKPSQPLRSKVSQPAAQAVAQPAAQTTAQASAQAAAAPASSAITYEPKQDLARWIQTHIFGYALYGGRAFTNVGDKTYSKLLKRTIDKLMSMDVLKPKPGELEDVAAMYDDLKNYVYSKGGQADFDSTGSFKGIEERIGRKTATPQQAAAQPVAQTAAPTRPAAEPAVPPAAPPVQPVTPPPPLRQTIPQPPQRAARPVEAQGEAIPMGGGRPVEPAPLGLPSGNVLPPTTGRVASNPYRELYDQLIAEAQQRQSAGGMSPGREDLELEQILAGMSQREGLSLDELIERAFPRSRESTLRNPELISNIKERQRMRGIVGEMPIRTNAERIPAPTTASDAAITQSRLGFEPKPSRTRVPEPEAAPDTSALDALQTRQRQRVQGEFVNRLSRIQELERPVVGQNKETVVSAPKGVKPSAEQPLKTKVAQEMTKRESNILKYFEKNPNATDKHLKDVFNMDDAELARMRRLSKGEDAAVPLTDREQSIVEYIRDNPKAENSEIKEIYKINDAKINRLRQRAAQPEAPPKAAAPAAEAAATPRESAILDYVKRNPRSKSSDLKKMFGASEVEILNALAKGDEAAANRLLTDKEKEIVKYIKQNPKSNDDIVEDVFHVDKDKLQALRRIAEGKKSEVAPEAKTPTTEPPKVDDVEGKTDLNETLFGTGSGNMGIRSGSGKSGSMESKQLTNKAVLDDRTFAQQAEGVEADWVDRTKPLRKISEETRLAAKDVGRAQNIANRIIHDKFVTNEGEVVGDSYNDIMKTIRGLNEEAADYATAQHAITRMEGRGDKVYADPNITVESLKEKVKNMKARYPKVAQGTQMLTKMFDNLMEGHVREGMATQEMLDTFRTQNPTYVPNARQETFTENLARKATKGGKLFSGSKGPVYKYAEGGSGRKIISPFRTSLEMIPAFINSQFRNRTMQEIYKAAMENPEGLKHIVEVVETPETLYDDFMKYYKEGDLDGYLERLDNEYSKLNTSDRDFVVTAMIDGKPKHMKIKDPEAIKTLMTMGSEDAGVVMGAARMLSRATKQSATGSLAPIFSLVASPIDTAAALINTGSPAEAARHLVIDAPHAIISLIGEKLKIPELVELAEKYKLVGEGKLPKVGTLARNFRRAGGGYSHGLQTEKAVTSSDFELKRHAPLTKEFALQKLVQGFKAPIRAGAGVGDIFENFNRLAKWKREVAKHPDRTPQNVRKEIQSSRDITIDFSQRGRKMDTVEALFPYSNAAIQGVNRMYQNFKSPKKALATLGGMTSLVVGPKLAEYAMHKDDPEYQSLTKREKYRNLILNKNADGTFNKVPMPPEYNAIGAMINDILERTVADNPQAFKGSADALVNAYLPPFLAGAAQGLTQGTKAEGTLAGATNTSILAPLAAVLGNKSHTGAPVVSPEVADRAVEDQYDARTTAPAKWIGEKVGLAPMKVDYLLKQYGGDIAKYVFPMTSDVGAGTRQETLLKRFIVDPVFTNTLTADFYNAKTKYKNAESSADELGKELPSWYNKTIANKMKHVSTKATRLKDDLKEIKNDSKLTAKERSQKMRDVQAKINLLYTDINEELVRSGFKFQNR